MNMGRKGGITCGLNYSKQQTLFFFFLFIHLPVLSCWELVSQTAMAVVEAPNSGATDCVTKVALSISCDNLLDKDAFSKSDPICVVFMNTSGSYWSEVRDVIRAKSL